MGYEKELDIVQSLLSKKGFDKESNELKNIKESFVFPNVRPEPRRLTRVQEQNRERERSNPNMNAPREPFEEGEEIIELSPSGEEKKVIYQKKPVVEPEYGLRPKVLKKLAAVINTLESKGYKKLASKLSEVTYPIMQKQASIEQHEIPYIEKVYEKSDSLNDLIKNLGELSKFYTDMSKHIESFRKAHGKENLGDKDIIRMVRKADRETEKKISKLMHILNNKKK